MESWLGLAGLGLGLGGALLLALGDSLLSRSLLVYMDAIESNVGKTVTALRAGSKELEVIGIDGKRDRGQNRAQALKAVGWLALTAGFALQLAAAWLRRSPG